MVLHPGRPELPLDIRLLEHHRRTSSMLTRSMTTLVPNPQARTTSTGRCLSVASAPTRPSLPLDPFEPPNYSQSAYAGSSKGKGGPSKGGKGGVFPRGEFAGIAPSGRPVISGGATGLEVLEIALANWPVLEPTKGGTPPDMQPELCKLYGPPPPVDAEYFRERCSSPDWFDSDEDLACYTGYDN